MAMDPNRRPLTSRDYRWVQALAGWLARKGVSANGISIAGMVFATLGAIAYLASARLLRLANWPAETTHPFAGMCFLRDAGFALAAEFTLVGAVVFIQLRLMCNLLDGLVAVEGGRKGRAGQLFNEAPDRFADVVLLAASGSAMGVPWLGWMAAAFAVSTAYARAFGASLGLGQDFCGPFAKPQRMFFLTLGTVGEIFRTYFGDSNPISRALIDIAVRFRIGSVAWLSPINWTLWLIALGTLFTFLRRIVRIYRQLP